MQKSAIVKVDDRPHFSLSPIFVIPKKKSGGLRVISNLKRINVFIPPQHFRMESLAAVLPQLHKDDWAERLTIDLHQTSCGIASLRQSGYLDDWLLVGRELQVPPGAAHSENSRAHSTVGLPSEFGEVFSDSLSNSGLSGRFFRHSEASGTALYPTE